MSDAYVRLQFSDNGGMDWENWEQESIGEVGQYGTRPVFTRLGSTYQRVWRIRTTSPRKRDLLGAVIHVMSTEG